MRFRPVFQSAFEVDATPKTRLPPKWLKNTLISIAKRHYFMLQSKTYQQPKGVCDPPPMPCLAMCGALSSKTYQQPKGVCDRFVSRGSPSSSRAGPKRTNSRKAFVTGRHAVDYIESDSLRRTTPSIVSARSIYAPARRETSSIRSIEGEGKPTGCECQP